jgi:cysteine desulfurase
MGWEEPALSEVIRVSFGPATDSADIDRFSTLWARLAARRRAA